MKSWFVPFAAALALTPIALAQTTKPELGPSTSRMMPETFAGQALRSGEKAVSLAEMAAKKAERASVKEFAEMIAADHRQVNEQLRLILQQGAGPDRKPTAPGTEPNRSDTPPGVAPGAAPSASPEHKKLDGLSGAAFDAAFMETMVEGHTKSVALYESAVQSLPAGAAKKLAEDTLPKIKQHLEQAKSVQGALGEKKN